MKIVLACRVHPHHRPGGMPFVFHDRALALANMGHEVHAITTNGIQNCLVDDKYLVYSCKVAEPTVYSKEYAEYCQELCTSLQPDLIHLDSFHRDHMWWLEFLPRIRVGITMHGFGFGAFLTRWNMYRCGLERECSFSADDMLKEARALTGASVVFGVSRHEHHMLSEYYGLKQSKLLYNPIPQYFFDNPKPDNKKAKGWLCAAISGQNKRGFDLAQRAVKKTGSVINVVSGKSRRDMVAVHDSSNGLLIPTYYSQGFDLTVAESLIRGNPVIASDVGSYRLEAEIFPGGIFLFKCGSEEDLIDRLLSPPKYIPDCLDMFRPHIHAKNWLEAMHG